MALVCSSWDLTGRISSLEGASVSYATCCWFSKNGSKLSPWFPAQKRSALVILLLLLHLACSLSPHCLHFSPCEVIWSQSHIHPAASFCPLSFAATVLWCNLITIAYCIHVCFKILPLRFCHCDIVMWSDRYHKSYPCVLRLCPLSSTDVISRSLCCHPIRPDDPTVPRLFALASEVLMWCSSVTASHRVRAWC